MLMPYRATKPKRRTLGPLAGKATVTFQPDFPISEAEFVAES